MIQHLRLFVVSGIVLLGIVARPALGQSSAAVKPAPLAVAKPDPAVDTIVDSNPQTPGQLIQAAVVLADLDRVDLAKKYLQQLVAAKPNEDALAEAATEVEPATLLRLADNPALQPEGGQLAGAVLTAAAHVATDPARIQKEIDQLADPSRSVRRTALRKILAAHEDAVPELVAALKDGNRQTVHPLARTALVELGEQAVPALVAALESNDDKLNLQVIDVLRQIGSRDAVAYLALPATAEGSSNEVRAAGRAALNEITGSKNPTAVDAQALLVAEIDRYLKHDQLLKRDANGNVDVWRWDAKAGKLVRENLPPDLAYPTLANRLAADLLELNPEDPVAKRMYLISGLETVARRAGLDQPLASDDPVVAKASEFGPATVENALLMAIANDNYPAAAAAAQVLGNTGDRSLLESRDGHFSPLVYAVSQGDRRLRFAAAEAMMKLKPASAFAGSSDLMTALAMFADSPGEHRALVAFPNSVVAGQLAAMLTSLGFDVDIALNSRQAFLKGIASGDYELILLSSRLDHPPVWVILPELRHNPVTAYTPIALLAEDSEDDLARMQTLAADNGLTTALARPVTTEGMKFLVDRTIARAGAEFVPADVRLRQALAATEWLKQLNAVSPREFDLVPFEKQIGRMLFRPATSAAAAEMLAVIGKQTAQEALVALADMATQPLEMRQTAATAFSEAVRKHGIQLTTKEIVQQYARYNQSEIEDRETQQLLGLILDAIELPTAVHGKR